MRFFGSASTVAAPANMNVVVINLDFDTKWEVFRPDHPQGRYSQLTTRHSSSPSAPRVNGIAAHGRVTTDSRLHCDHRELWLIVSDG
jgi:hypothetical protein